VAKPNAISSTDSLRAGRAYRTRFSRLTSGSFYARGELWRSVLLLATSVRQRSPERMSTAPLATAIRLSSARHYPCDRGVWSKRGCTSAVGPASATTPIERRARSSRTISVNTKHRLSDSSQLHSRPPCWARRIAETPEPRHRLPASNRAGHIRRHSETRQGLATQSIVGFSGTKHLRPASESNGGHTRP